MKDPDRERRLAHRDLERGARVLAYGVVVLAVVAFFGVLWQLTETPLERLVRSGVPPVAWLLLIFLGLVTILSGDGPYG